MYSPGLLVSHRQTSFFMMWVLVTVVGVAGVMVGVAMAASGGSGRAWWWCALGPGVVLAGMGAVNARAVQRFRDGVLERIPLVDLADAVEEYRRVGTWTKGVVRVRGVVRRRPLGGGVGGSATSPLSGRPAVVAVVSSWVGGE